MSTDSSEAKAAKFWKGWEEADGRDIRIVSSDGFAFMVQSAWLNKLSSVFSGMIETCTPSESRTLELSDKIIDTGAVLATFLAAEAHHSEAPYRLLHTVDGWTWIEDLNLARKYDCAHLRTNVELSMHRIHCSLSMDEDYESLTFGALWPLAAELKQWYLCGRCISALPTRGRSREFWDDPGRRLDLRYQAPDDIQKLARFGYEFAWALNQANEDAFVFKGEHTRRDYFRLGERFIAHMRYTLEYGGDHSRVE